MGRGALGGESPLPALRAGLQGAGEPGTRVRGEAGQGVVQPGLSPVTPQPRFLPHAGPPLCSPLSPAFLSLTHPRCRRISSLGRGMPAWRTGLGPSNGSCSTAPRLHERDGGAPAGRARGHGSRARGGQGRGRGKGELRAPALLPRRLRAVPPPRPGRPRRPAGHREPGIALPPGIAPGASSPPPSTLGQGLGGTGGDFSALRPRLPAPSGAAPGRALPGPCRTRRFGERGLATGSLLFAFRGSLCVCTPEAVSADNCPQCTLRGVRLHPFPRGCSEACLLFFRGKDGSVGVGVPVVRMMGSFGALS